MYDQCLFVTCIASRNSLNLRIQVAHELKLALFNTLFNITLTTLDFNRSFQLIAITKTSSSILNPRNLTSEKPFSTSRDGDANNKSSYIRLSLNSFVSLYCFLYNSWYTIYLIQYRKFNDNVLWGLQVVQSSSNSLHE